MSRRQLPRATAAQLDAATFLPGEIAVDTTNDELRYDGDGSTVGGIALARKDGTNLTASASLVTATGSTTARTLANRFGEVANVKDYGATGDGTTNDTTAISAAITAAGTGGSVYFPEGVYIFNSVLTQLSGQRWFGAGRAVSILRLASSVTSIAVCVTASDFAENYSIEDLQIDGNRANITPATDLYNTFYLVRGPRGGKRGLYRNLLLSNSWGRALQTSNESVSEYAEDILVDNVWVKNAGTKAISATQSKRVTISNCYAEVDAYTAAENPVGGAAASSGSCFECNDAHDVVIKGCHGVQIDAAIFGPGIRFVNTCSSIRAFGNTIDGAEYLAFIQNANDVDFYGNTGRDLTGNAILVADADGETGTCRRIRVHHNRVIDTDDAYVLITANNSAHVPEVEVYVYGNDFVQSAGSPTYGIYNEGVIAPAVSGTCLVYQWGNTFTGTIPNQLDGPAVAEILPEPRSQYSATSTTNTTPAIIAKNATDNASVAALRIEGDRATPASADSVYMSFYLSDTAGNQDEFVRMTATASDATSTSEDGSMALAVLVAGSLASRLFLSGTILAPSTNDVLALGSTSSGWADLHLATGGVINWNAGDVTVTHSANALAFAGASSGYSFDATVEATQTSSGTHAITAKNTTDAATVLALRIEGDRATPTTNDSVGISYYLSDSGGTQTEFIRLLGRATDVTDGSEDGAIDIQTRSGGTLANRYFLDASVFRPATNDAIALGAATLSFSDLFLATGGVINFNNSNLTLTHASGQITNSGAWINTGSMTHSGQVIEGVQSLSGAGAVNITTPVTAYTSTGAAQALTLADGVVGQVKRIVHVVDGGSGVLTPTNLAGGTTITFTNAAESATLQFLGTEWYVVALQGAVLA